MKKIVAFFVVLLPLIVTAQVRVAMPTQSKSELEYRYDSTKNVMPFVQYYVGQDLFVMPAASAYTAKHQVDNVFGRGLKTTEAGTSLDVKVPLSEVQGRTLHVTGIEPNMMRGSHIGDYLVMEDKETGENFYFRVPSVKISFFPFVTLGFKEKFERENKDTKFVYRSYSLNDFVTGEKMDAHKTVWTFKEIIAMPDVMKAGFYLVDDAGTATAVEEMSGFIKESDIKSYVKKYGQAMVDATLDGEIKKGMPADLVRIAKGQPEHINSASYGQQWVYKNQYIYIKDGKVTDWN